MQLSERAKELIPKARIVSFATWKNLYSDEVIAIFQQADNRSEYLTDEDLELLQNLVPANSLIDISQKDSQEQAGCLFHNNYGRGLMLAQVRLLREQAPNLVANGRAKVLAEFPNIAEPGNDLYPPARAEACWRDFWHFLRSVTYGIAGGNPEFLSQEGLKNMELLYQELRVPVPAMLCGLEQLKIVSLQQFSSEEQDLLGLNFDHLISALKLFS